MSCGSLYRSKATRGLDPYRLATWLQKAGACASSAMLWGDPASQPFTVLVSSSSSATMPSEVIQLTTLSTVVEYPESKSQLDDSQNCSPRGRRMKLAPHAFA